MQIRSSLLNIAYPVLSVAGRIGLPKRLIPEMFIVESWRRGKPGDVFVTRTNWEASNLLTPKDFWKHAAICRGEHRKFVIEAVGKGVQATGFLEFLMGKDYAMLLRPKFADAEQAAKAAVKAMSLVGQPYDFQFMPANRAWYCSEVVWWSYDAALEKSPFTPRETMGVQTVTPQDFANALGKWEVVLDSRTLD